MQAPKPSGEPWATTSSTREHQKCFGAFQFAGSIRGIHMTDSLHGISAWILLTHVFCTDNIRTSFGKLLTNSSPQEPSKTIARTKFWANLGFGAFLNERGRRVRNSTRLKVWSQILIFARIFCTDFQHGFFVRIFCKDFCTAFSHWFEARILTWILAPFACKVFLRDSFLGSESTSSAPREFHLASDNKIPQNPCITPEL